MFCNYLNEKKVFSFFLLALFYVSGFTQGIVVSGKVIEKKSSEPLIAATVSLHKQADFVLIAGMVTDTAGSFAFKSVPDGNYILEISYIGFYPQQKEITKCRYQTAAIPKQGFSDTYCL